MPSKLCLRTCLLVEEARISHLSVKQVTVFRNKAPVSFPEGIVVSARDPDVPDTPLQNLTSTS